MDEECLEKLKSKYTGETAKTYENGRQPTEHWRREQRVVRMLLERSTVEAGNLLLDVPVGTGRFFPSYKKFGYQTIGVDASSDMLSEAQKKADDIDYRDVELMEGDILDLPLRDDAAYLSVCIRLMNWFDFPTFQQALRELRRVSSHELIVGVRLSTGQYRLQPTQALQRWKKDLKDGCRWAIRSVWKASLNGASSDSSSDPPLIDHSEEAVRQEFQRQGLAVIEEKHVLMFTGEPQLSTLYRTKELPYQIFRLQVGN